MMRDLAIVVTPKPGEITANFDEIKEALREQMTAYEVLEVTEENIPERKADVATLRKISKAIDDERKKVKKAYNAPLDAFESQVKELTGIIGEQVDRINEGLDVFEKERINKKRRHILELYKREASEVAEFMPLEKIYGTKWDNKTCSDNEIVSDIQTKVLEVKANLAAIRGLHSKYEEQLIGAYKIGGITAAMQKHADFVEAERTVEERERAMMKTTPATISPVMEEKPVRRDSDEPVLVIKITGQKNIEEVKGLLQFNEIPYEEVRA